MTEEELNDPEAAAYRAELMKLHEKVGPIIRDHLQTLPPSRDKVYQALNVLAMETAAILVATDDDLAAANFFMESLEGNIQYIRENRASIAKDELTG